MALNFCLPRDKVQSFKEGLKSGEINPNELATMSSVNRREFLSKYVGESQAKRVNAEFESKMLLKDQQKGYLSWAKNVSGIRPQTRRDLISKIERMNPILTPEDESAFLEDLASTRLGIDITEAESQKIANLSRNVSEAEAKRSEDGTFSSEKDRLDYGRSVEDLTDYVAELKRDTEKLSFGNIKRDIKENPVGILGKVTNKTAGNMKSLSASLDNSSIFRQGWKTLITNPNVWRKNAAKTFLDISKTIGGKNTLREVNADIISRPNYDRMVKAKLAIKNPEEAFPESLAEKVPALGRLYKASEAAYTGFVYKTRADVFDKYLQMAEKAGVDINDKKQLEAIGKLVNSLTGRGNLGKLEPVGSTVNNVFFSPRFLKSNVDTLTAHSFDNNITPFARKEAAKNLIKIASATSGILALANAIHPGSVDFDPRSSDFGKIKIGNTRFDVTGGMGSLVTLAAREITGKSKSSTTGKITDLRNDDFGARDQLDVLYDFFRNKLSPAASATVNSITGKDTLGNKTTPLKEFGKTAIPIGIQNAYEQFKDPNAAAPLAAIIADGLGISANNYSATKDNGWEDSKSKELIAFKNKVGGTKFKQANDKFNQKLNNYIDRIRKEESYNKLSDNDKGDLLAKYKTKLQKEVLKDYGFQYKSPKVSKNKTLESLLNK